MVSSWIFVASLALVAFSAHGQTFPPTQDIVFDTTEPPEATTSVVIIEDPTTADVIIEDPTTADVIIEDPTTADVIIVDPTTAEVTTEAPFITTEAPTTPEFTTEAPFITTEAPTTPEVTTEAPTTPEVTTEAPTTPEVTTEAPTTPEVTTEAPTTPEVTTEAPTTPEVTTEAPTTPEVTTEAPTTPEVTTEAPTTPFITTAPPTKPPKKRKVVLVFVDDLESDYAGAASLSAKATFDGENDGAFTFNDFNLHFPSVPADLLTNYDYSSTRSLGFAARLGSVNVTNDCRGLEAQIEGSAHSGIYETLDSYRFFVNSPNDENYYAPNQLVDTTAMVSVDSEEGDGMLLDRLYDLSMTKPTNETLHIKVHIKIVLWIGPSSAQRRLGILPLKIVLWKVIWVKVSIISLSSIEKKLNLI